MEDKPFVNRENELKALKETVKKKGYELILVYGRRRIGKSRLLNELQKITEIDLFVTMEDSDYRYNLEKFAKIVGQKYNFPNYSPPTFKEIFENLPDKTKIIIDEYSYLQNCAGEFQAIFEEIIKKKEIKLILCGSLIRIMEDLNYSITSPLYGRATQIIKLEQLRFKDVIKWYGENKEEIEKIFEIYFTIGGVPRYLEMIEPPSIKTINDQFFSKNGILLREGKLLIKESFPSSNIYPKILFEISRGNSEASYIANKIGIKSNEISKYLSILIDYGFVEKMFPIFNKGKKEVRFYIKDNFFNFWSRFVWPIYNELESGHMYSPSKKELNTFFGRMFEKSIIDIISNANLFFIPNKTGRVWGKHKVDREQINYEIDLVSINEDNNEILFGECKWKEDVNADEIFKELKEKAKYIKWNLENRKEHFVIFAKSFKKKSKNCYDIEDIKNMILTK